jgi:hypothetical protein
MTEEPIPEAQKLIDDAAEAVTKLSVRVLELLSRGQGQPGEYFVLLSAYCVAIRNQMQPVVANLIALTDAGANCGSVEIHHVRMDADGEITEIKPS